MSRQYCLTLALHDDDELIKLYEKYQQAGNVWPEVITSIEESGIENMSIFRMNAQLIMVIEVNETFSFEDKAKSDLNNTKVPAWERLMDTFQKTDHVDTQKSKWQLMDKIFSLTEHKNQ